MPNSTSLVTVAFAAALTVVAGGWSGEASAGALTYANQFALRYNALGLQDEFRIGYRTKLGDKPADDILFGKSYLSVGPILRASPQFVQPGLYIKTLPIAVFEFTASAVRVVGLSTLQDVQQTSYYTNGTKDAATAAGDIIGDGWQASIQPRLQYKTGPIAIRNTALFRMFKMEGIDGGLFYDQSLDVVTPYDSWVWQNDFDVLYAHDDKQWVLGARYTYVKPLANGMDTVQRAGPVFAYKFKEKNPGGGFANPALIVLPQWHLQHAYRTGQSNSRALPYMAVAFAFTGRLTD